MENKNTNEELEYFCNKLKETMGKGLPKKYLETTDLGEVDKEYGHRFKERIEKHLTEVDKIKNMIDDNLKNQPTTDVMCSLTDDEKLLVVKKLREDTGWGIMDCKRALNQSKWNYDNAKSWLIQFRKKSGIFFD
jgi:hypothetical protein